MMCSVTNLIVTTSSLDHFVVRISYLVLDTLQVRVDHVLCE